MKHFYLSLLVFFGIINLSHAQDLIAAKIIDSITQNPIPYATISLNNTSGVISNDFGVFHLNIKKKFTKTDSLFISCLGYETKQLPIKSVTDSIISLSPKSIDLDEVLISNKNYSIDEIIDFIKDSLPTNYSHDPQKNKLFFRQSYHSNIVKKNIVIEKTTIPEFNQNFIDSILRVLPKKSSNYTEILGVLYKNNAADTINKLDIIKASELYDKNNEIDSEKLEEKFNAIARKHIKRDSYFKIKSGWFGTKTEIDSSLFETPEEKESVAYLEAKKKKEKERKENFLKYRKRTISNLENRGFLNEDSNLNIIHKSNRYEFELLDYAFLNGNFVYKIAFKPKRGEDYKGTMYVNTDDFAIIRLDYENVKALRDFSLLGVSVNHYLQRGTIIYEKNKADTYALKYFEIVDGESVGIKRPLKIIEKNKNVKGRRKQNEVSANINLKITNINKKELVVFENDNITKEAFNNFKEKAAIKPTYLPHYDPDFWKGYNVIEPNQAIKDFKSIE
ncbi:carboxypeptidase-like regulatory domain-containing protein [Lacinutrix himadriensis]|uniref:carboxypeptidase-like regulatory domain-containing protein n=1 Tax=Lacinutrix himadriensis TaxID=641549 RepID=UPI0006E3F7C7|nr:carboxypeptidase-like regulatory domain-containing protein [Lacinutrix himadriensis]